MTTQKRAMRQKLEVWMINEGARKIFFTLWTLIQCLAFALGLVNYHLKDNLNGARQRFGLTYEIARASALVLHFDVAFVLLPVCRAFVSWLRRSPLDDFVPFEHSTRLWLGRWSSGPSCTQPPISSTPGASDKLRRR
ncbi:hypothetical protein ACM66B_002532 [Microbotryomycetes sp. NB124-2]